MDYGVLLSTFERETGRRAAARMSQQHRLYACLRTAILDGRIAEGARLAPSRTLADELGIARNSVLYAYERLAAEGFVIGTRQGTVVARVGLRDAPAAAAAVTAAAVDASADASADATADVTRLSRRVAHVERTAEGIDESLPFVPGTPALDEFPLAQWRRCVERAWRDAVPAQLGYQPAAGDPTLRDAIAGYLRVSRGVRCDAEQIVVTDGTQNALDLCARALADAGDTAWIENPGYHGARNAFLAADLRVVPIGVDAEGLAPHPDDWRARTPKLVYITPSHQYPLGAVMSLERRLALVAQARAAGAWIVEDDYDSEFRYQGRPLPALKSLDRRDRVIYCGTFSKVMFPGLRLAYAVVPERAIERIGRVALSMNAGSPTLLQAATADFIEQGHFARHLKRMRALYAERRMLIVQALRQAFGERLIVDPPSGGIQFAVWFADGSVDDVAVAARARDAGLAVVPLSTWYANPRARTTPRGLVMGFANIADAREAGRHARTLRACVDG